jgi:phosphoribosyl 1,2-cyclic phosphodiesterase
MLANGPYPWDLKERITSRVGHLSNHETGVLLKSLLNGQIHKILLAHLSEENNLPELAKSTVLEYIGEQNDHLVEVIEQRKVSDVYEF